MTILAHYEHVDGSIVRMIFGDSYKTWNVQMDEYERYGRRDVKLVALYKSSNKFVQSGLKWCDYEHYQEELDEFSDIKKPLIKWSWKEAMTQRKPGYKSYEPVN